MGTTYFVPMLFRVAFLPAILFPLCAWAQGPDLVGYWQNWNDASAPYIALDAVDARYSMIEVAFALPAVGTTYNMTFTPDQGTQAAFITKVAALQTAGRKVLISIGGATATVKLNSNTERDQFVTSMTGLLNTYGFDGFDLDLEGASVSVTGGTIAAPVDQPIIRMIAAVKTIMQQFRVQHGRKMLLTMAPETAFVQGGQSAYGGIWGAYLPIIHALRDSLDVLHVQLYNSGSMYGADGGIYNQGTADFIISQTEAVLHGFSTAGGIFQPLPPEKVVIGTPACSGAAGGGYVAPAVLAAAVNYLRGTGPRPGTYTRFATYPFLRGLMTWSINWDAVSTCGPSYEFAQSYQALFLNTTVKVDLKAWLEGPYDTSTGKLKDALRLAGLVPLTEPYTALGFANAAAGGAETTSAAVLSTSGDNAIVDWVRIELRSSADPSMVVATRQGLIQRDGDVVSAFDGASPVTFAISPANYYVALRHRNHLGAMTQTIRALSSTATTIDLRTSATATCGTEARKTIGTAQALWAGNVWLDATLKYTGSNNDRDPILQAVGGAVPTATITGYRTEDTDLSGVVKYTGALNDRDPILANIGGAVPTNTRTEQLP